MTRPFYDTDVTDNQWELIPPLLPPAKPGGQPHTANLRGLVNLRTQICEKAGHKL
jgi:putative transposase